jgi:hypothetical protein
VEWSGGLQSLNLALTRTLNIGSLDLGVEIQRVFFVVESEGWPLEVMEPLPKKNWLFLS